MTDLVVRRQLVVLGMLVSVFAVGWVLIKGWPQRVPVIRGTLFDARTGQPIPGALVQRQLFSTPPFSLVDTRTERAIHGTEVEVHTDRQGRFEFPATWAARVVSMSWVVYKPGFMPGLGCFKAKGWREGGCGGAPSVGPLDPWVKVSFAEKRNGISMDVNLSPPTLHGIAFLSYAPNGGTIQRAPSALENDPWASYFSRLCSLVAAGRLPLREFASEVARFLDGNAISDSMLVPLARLVEMMRAGSDPATQSDTRRIRRVLREFCTEVPRSSTCDLLSVWSIVGDPAVSPPN